MRVLRRDLTGDDVRAWQIFLVGQGLLTEEATGTFDDATLQSTIDFQRAHNLGSDGIVGNETFGLAMQLGFSLLPDPNDSAENGVNWPPKPDFQPLVSSDERASLFGAFTYSPAPTATNPEAITIHGTWYQDNIVNVVVPQLKGVAYAPANQIIQFHQAAQQQLLALWAAWEDAGLLPLVLTWSGSYAARFIRGSRTTLSNHAFGTAFDVNTPWNALGAQPALADKKGSVRKLVQLANENGFWWGGHWGFAGAPGRTDGMHFEVARIIE